MMNIVRCYSNGLSQVTGGPGAMTEAIPQRGESLFMAMSEDEEYCWIRYQPGVSGAWWAWGDD